MNKLMYACLFLFSSIGFSQDLSIETVEATGANTGAVRAVLNTTDTPPTEFTWTDSDGNIVQQCTIDETYLQTTTPPYYCEAAGLNPRRYCLEASAPQCDQEKLAVAKGCYDVVGSNCQNSLTYDFQSFTDVCSDQLGELRMTNLGGTNVNCWGLVSNSHNIEWETGYTGSILRNIRPGQYCATITADPSGACPECYEYVWGELESIDSETLSISGTTVSKGYCEYYCANWPYKRPCAVFLVPGRVDLDISGAYSGAN